MDKNLPKNHVFGYQLLLDLYECAPGVCDDLDLCYAFLDEIVSDIKMQKQSPPSIFRSDAEKFPEKAGLSGWVPLIESSVVIHTLSTTNFISVDIYSCRFFDKDVGIKVCKKFFNPKKVDTHFIQRGKHYYESESDFHKLVVEDKHSANPKITVTKK